MLCLSRNAFARSGVSLAGSTEMPITRTSEPKSSSAPRIVCTCAGHVSRQVEYTNANTTGSPCSDALVTVFPSWSLRLNSGTR